MIESSDIIIPKRFNEIIKKDVEFNLLVNHTKVFIERIIKDSDHFFFTEYTNHGIDHINQVLDKTDELIPEKSIKHLDAKNISYLILAVFIHDIGMSLNLHVFNFLISSDCPFKIHSLDDTSYSQLWQEYIEEHKHWTNSYKVKLFGEIVTPKIQIQYDSNKITEIEKKFIGEFIRRHHPRIGHDLIVNFFPLRNNESKKLLDINLVSTGHGNIAKLNKAEETVGLIARSHGIDFRYINTYLKSIDSHNWMNLFEIKTTYLMALLRIGDFLLVDSKRISSSIFVFKEFFSPISVFEFIKHSKIIQGARSHKDPESYRFTVSEDITNEAYLAIKKLFKAIQSELDKTWALIGEAYSLDRDLNQLHLNYRRISSNVNESTFGSKNDIVFGEAKIELNKNLLPLLARKLYSNKLASIRELLQNAIDACKIRQEQEKEYSPKVSVSIEDSIVIIRDNGIGMSINDINNYLLKIGNSSKQTEYKSENITGRFGIGFLAGFILGDSVTYKTRKFDADLGYEFTLTMSDDMMENVTVVKLEDCSVGTEIRVPLSIPIIEELGKNKGYLGFCGEIDIESNLTLPIAKFKYGWRSINRENITINWTYRKHIEKFKTIYKNNFLNDFLIKDFEINFSNPIINFRSYVFNIIDNKEIASINLSREIGVINLSKDITNNLISDIILDSYLFLLGTKDYSTFKYAPSLYPGFTRRDEGDYIVYNSDGFNFLSNLNLDEYDIVVEYKGTVKKDIKLLRKYKNELSRTLIIYNSLDNFYSYKESENINSKFYKTQKSNIAKYSKIVNLLETNSKKRVDAVFDIHMLNSFLKKRKDLIKLRHKGFVNKMIPYEFDQRELVFKELFDEYRSRIMELRKNWKK